MIYFVRNPSVEIIKQMARKAGDFPDKDITPAKFLKRVITSILGLNSFFLISFVDEKKIKIDGFVMMSHQESFAGNVLLIEYAWTEKGYKWGKTLMTAVENVAKSLEYKKIVAETKRNTGALERKYGFKETARIISKEV